MGPIWGRHDPGGPHDGPMNFAIEVHAGMLFNIITVEMEWGHLIPVAVTKLIKESVCEIAGFGVLFCLYENQFVGNH